MADKITKAESVDTHIETRIHVEEFLATSSLDDLQKAGFRAVARNKIWRTRGQWELFMKEYKKEV